MRNPLSESVRRSPDTLASIAGSSTLRVSGKSSININHQEALCGDSMEA
jgi:hypothetical protein